MNKIVFYDVGARGGTNEWVSRKINHNPFYIYERDIISVGVEPNPEDYTKLKKKNLYDVLECTAIDTVSGARELNVCVDEGRSSLLLPNEELIETLDNAQIQMYKVKDKLQVQCIGINNFIKKIGMFPNILKLDVQGLEGALIMSLQDVTKVSCIYLEVSNKPLYKEQITSDEIFKYLIKLGFQPVVVNFKGAIHYEQDVVFINTGHITNGTKQQLHAIAIFLHMFKLDWRSINSEYIESVCLQYQRSWRYIGSKIALDSYRLKKKIRKFIRTSIKLRK